MDKSFTDHVNLFNIYVVVQRLHWLNLVQLISGKLCGCHGLWCSATKGSPNYFINLLREFNYIFFSLLLFRFWFLFLSFSCSSQMDKMPTDFLEIINKTITVGITDDLFSDTEKAQIIDDYSEWINKNDDKIATRYVICTCTIAIYRKKMPVFSVISIFVVIVRSVIVDCIPEKKCFHFFSKMRLPLGW